MTTADNYAAEAAAAKRSLELKLKDLPPPVLKLRLQALAGGGFDPSRPVDPLERSFAKQAFEMMETRDELERLEARYSELEANREPGLSKAQKVFSLSQLDEKRQLLQIRMIQAAEQSHTGAAQEARRVNAERDAKAAEVVAIRAAATARAEAMMLDNHPVVAGLAAAIVERKQAI